IETASRNKIAILTVVFNNGVMGAERDVLKASDKKYGAMTVGGHYSKLAEGLNVASNRVDKLKDIVPAIKEAVGVTWSGSPFLLEFVVTEGQGFSRYALPGLSAAFPPLALRFEEAVTMLRYLSAAAVLALIVVGAPAAAITPQEKMETCKFGA